jgi:hypothetical protein
MLRGPALGMCPEGSGGRDGAAAVAAGSGAVPSSFLDRTRCSSGCKLGEGKRSTRSEGKCSGLCEAVAGLAPVKGAAGEAAAAGAAAGPSSAAGTARVSA